MWDREFGVRLKYMRGWKLGALLGLAIVGWYWRWESGRIEGLAEGQEVRVRGQVSQQPSIKVDRFNGEEYQWIWVQNGSETFGLKGDRWKDVNYGDRVGLVGRIKELGGVSSGIPQQVETPPGFKSVRDDKGDFESLSPLSSLAGWNGWVERLRPRRWVVDKIQDLSVKKIDCKLLCQFRGQVLELFRRTLPRDEGGLLSGMVLGTKGELSSYFMKALRRSGTLHVVVASGFNVMLVGGTMAGILVLWVRRQVAVMLAMLGIWAYVAMVGWDAPVVRAGLMGSLAFVGIILGRVREAGWLLMVSSVLMLWWKPEWLWDVGFQLSVAATGGLIWVEPVLKGGVDGVLRQPEISHDFRRAQDDKADMKSLSTLSIISYPVRLFDLPVVGESLRTTVAAQIVVLPILLVNFGQVSVWSPIVNALVLWVVPVVTAWGMVLGMVYGVLGVLVEPVIKLLLWLVWPLLKYFVVVVSFFGRFETVEWQMPLRMGIIYYVVLIGVIKWRGKRERENED